MPIILISSDTIESGQQIAKATAERLQYQLLGTEILAEIAATKGLSAEKAAEALVKTPSAWRPGQSRRWLQHLATIEAEVLNRLKADNILCWGLAAHLYVRGVSHALKVRLVVDGAKQAAAIAEERGISIKKANGYVENTRRKRRQWSEAAFGQNELEPSMYDLVINLDQIDPDEAVGIISAAAGYRKFQPMTYSIRSLAENALAAMVKAKLLESLTDLRVQARDATVVVTSKALKRERQKKAAMIKEMAGTVEGVEFVEVHLINYVIRAAAESGR
ncbi:MAG: cytidylate kinase-like family protein [Desulfobacteraceae bacterium]|nr:MAG: cytidylate kinase-like family protein [Desulfobacteraceae bacterium]